MSEPATSEARSAGSARQTVTAADLEPAVVSLIQEELAAHRGISLLDLPAGDWSAETVIGGDALPADSIEQVSLATACAERFGLQQIGAGDYLLRYRRIGEWAELAAKGMHETGTVTFRTSGTTGTPAVITHALDELFQEVEVLAGLTGDVERVISLVPAHHIYGFLTTVLLPRYLGRPVIHTGRTSGLPPRDLGPGDWLVGFPLRWRQLLQLYPTLPQGVAAITSTAPCPAEVAHGLDQRGLSALLALYGSTETAGVGFRWAPEAPYQLMDHWRWDQGSLERLDRDGHVLRTVEPQDHLSFVDERRFHPRGRKDSIVQVGGRNVDPGRVAGIIGQCPGVAACSVTLEDTNGDARLQAHVVPESEATLDSETLRRELAAQLASAEQPGRIHVVDALPRTITGKPRGWTDAP